MPIIEMPTFEISQFNHVKGYDQLEADASDLNLRPGHRPIAITVLGKYRVVTFTIKSSDEYSMVYVPTLPKGDPLESFRVEIFHD